MKLTVKRVQTLSKPGMYADGGTLYLSIAKGGSKSWVQRITIEGKRTDLGLGSCELAPLSKARTLALSNRLAVLEGRNPKLERRRANTPTFAEAARKTYATERKAWKNAKHDATWLQSLERHVFPALGDTTVDRISKEQVIAVLTACGSASTMKRIRQRIRTTLAWAVARDYVPGNVADERIDAALPKARNGVKHLEALPYREAPAALAAIGANERAGLASRLCFRFLVLTAARSGEARGATWSEIDTEARLWTIPGSRMKANTEHRVPLSDEALAVLEAARPLADGSDLIFPSSRKRGCQLSDVTLMWVLKINGMTAKVHGFRSTFRDWASERTEADHAVMELSLAHRVGSAVERAYSRSDLIDKRRALMDAWGAFVANP